MSERPIPEDIAAEARRIADLTIDRFLDLGIMRVVPEIERSVCAERFARVIMTERDRYRDPEVVRRHGAILDLWAQGLTGREIAIALSYRSRGFVLRIVREARQRGDHRAVPRRPGTRPRQ